MERKKQTIHIFQFTHGNICIEQLGLTKYIVWFVKHGNAFDFLKSLFCLLFSFIFDTNFGRYSTYDEFKTFLIHFGFYFFISIWHVTSLSTGGNWYKEIPPFNLSQNTKSRNSIYMHELKQLRVIVI